MGRLNSYIFTLVILPVLLNFSIKAQEWSYSGENGPANWASIAAEYQNCSNGERQSPINIVPNLNGNLQPLVIRYQDNGAEVSNNGNSVHISFEPRSELAIGINRYQLSQVNLHTPSEHQITGQGYGMEAQLIHTDSEGKILILAILYEVGNENKQLNNALSVLPQASQANTLISALNSETFLPENLDYFRYVGSLTTPPCLESLTWIILKTPAEISQEQVDSLRNVITNENNRPVQPINGRVVVE